MTCTLARGLFSDLRDGALSGADRGTLAAHLDGCGACAAEWRSYNAALDALADLPGIECAGEVAARVFDRLDLENRKPGLAQPSLQWRRDRTGTHAASRPGRLPARRFRC